MGVHGLWPLLEPVGRRVNIEALTNKRLAVGESFELVFRHLKVSFGTLVNTTRLPVRMPDFLCKLFDKAAFQQSLSHQFLIF